MSDLQLQADLNNVMLDTAEVKERKSKAHTVTNAPEPSFEEIKPLLSDRPLQPINRPRLSN